GRTTPVFSRADWPKVGADFLIFIFSQRKQTIAKKIWGKEIKKKQIGRASWRGRGENSGGAGSFKKKKTLKLALTFHLTPLPAACH
ncbi:hypothetical protein, partial [Shigella flexneri]|uniref:hypothetical protein n=1 Tax=Shigella flexneri TaxID=623 RepID=UPI001C0A7025